MVIIQGAAYLFPFRNVPGIDSDLFFDRSRFAGRPYPSTRRGGGGGLGGGGGGGGGDGVGGGVGRGLPPGGGGCLALIRTRCVAKRDASTSASRLGGGCQL